MAVGGEAEAFVKHWYEGVGETLIRMTPKEIGFDFRTENGQMYVEVKGTTARELSDVLFRYLTNGQYERIKWCLRNRKEYWLHLLTGVGSGQVMHYRIPGDFILKNVRPEVVWNLPIRKGISNFRVETTQQGNRAPVRGKLPAGP